MASDRGKIDKTEIAELKARVSLSAIIGHDIQLYRGRGELVGLCPFHDDKDPSLGVVEEKRFFKCFVCGAYGDVIDWLMLHRGMQFGEARRYLVEWSGVAFAEAVAAPRAAPKDSGWRPIHPVPADAPVLLDAQNYTGRIFNPKYEGLPDKEWTRLRPKMVFPYRDAVGALLGYVLRCEARKGGKFTPAISFCENDAGERRWCIHVFAEPRPLYGLDRLAARPDADVVVVEGEKAADAGQRLLPDHVVVTWPGGSNSVARADWSALAGRRVTLIPDQDDAGRGAMFGYERGSGGMAPGIAEFLGKLGATVEEVETPRSMPEKWDLADAEYAGWTTAEVLRWLAANLRGKRSEDGVEGLPEERPGDGDPWSGAEVEPGVGEKPVVMVVANKLAEAIDEAEGNLLAAEAPFYQHGGMIVRPMVVPVPIADGKKALGTRLVQVRLNHLIERMTTTSNFMRFDKKSEAWVSIDCPAKVAAAYLERDGLWKLRLLWGVISAPTLRPDGSVLDKPGYDEATGLLYDPQGAAFPALPTYPTKAQARLALDELKALIGTFPFVDKASESVALSAILTALVRRSLPTAPLHAFTAPVAGSGKTLLGDIASAIAVGQPAPVIAQGQTPEEMEKRLGSALIAGDPVISIDNCEQELGGELLCQMLTQPMVKVRILGQSINLSAPTSTLLLATGNNLRLIGDLTRRALLCSLDPECERPELREFDNEPLRMIAERRGHYVMAGLMVLRAFVVAGSPGDAAPIGSFEAWSRRVRDPLIWLGEADPCQTMENARQEDPRRQALGAVLYQWAKVLGNRRVQLKDVIEKAAAQQIGFGNVQAKFINPEFREALLAVAGEGGAVNSRRLGKWLSGNKGRIIKDMSITVAGNHAGTMVWMLNGKLPPDEEEGFQAAEEFGPGPVGLF